MRKGFFVVLRAHGFVLMKTGNQLIAVFKGRHARTVGTVRLVEETCANDRAIAIQAFYESIFTLTKKEEQ